MQAQLPAFCSAARALSALLLQASVEEHIESGKLQAAREHFLAQAHEAIEQHQYRQAVRLLETCQADGIFSGEIAELLEYARHEAEQQQRESLVESSFAEAQALLAKGAYSEAIRFSRTGSEANQ